MSGPRLARNVGLNVLGQALPMAVALLAIPPLVAGLGEHRFGALALAWAVIGYFGLFDLGLGRALTQIVAERLGARRDAELPLIIWTALACMALLGLLGAVVVIALAPWLVRDLLNVPAELRAETVVACYALSASLPFVTGTGGLAGLLMAQQRFDLLNALRIPLAAFSFVGPLLVLPFTRSLVPVVCVLVAGRAGGFLAHLLLCLRTFPGLRRGLVLRPSSLFPLISLGTWITVSNVISPLMVSLDRFVIGALISVAAVTYYATPYELVTKLWLVPHALLPVLFPAFAATFAREPRRAARLFERGLAIVFVSLFPAVLAIVVLARPGLHLWLGPEFARHSTPVLQWLAVGILINSLAQVPFTFLQAIGRPGTTAALHVIELPIYLTGLWWLIQALGIQGAALAWVGRVALDGAMLFAMAMRHLPSGLWKDWRASSVAAAASVALIAATVPSRLAPKLLFLGGALACFAAAAWYLILSAEDREALFSRLGASRRGA